MSMCFSKSNASCAGLQPSLVAQVRDKLATSAVLKTGVIDDFENIIDRVLRSSEGNTGRILVENGTSLQEVLLVLLAH